MNSISNDLPQIASDLASIKVITPEQVARTCFDRWVCSVMVNESAHQEEISLTIVTRNIKAQWLKINYPPKGKKSFTADWQRCQNNSLEHADPEQHSEEGRLWRPVVNLLFANKNDATNCSTMVSNRNPSAVGEKRKWLAPEDRAIISTLADTMICVLNNIKSTQLRGALSLEGWVWFDKTFAQTWIPQITGTNSSHMLCDLNETTNAHVSVLPITHWRTYKQGESLVLPEQTWGCSECERKYWTPIELYQHTCKKRISPKKFQCRLEATGECLNPQSFGSLNPLESHFITNHPGELPMKCLDCGFTTSH